MGDWEDILNFAMRLISHSLEHINSDIIDQRIALHNLDHANELIMKAFLLKEGYIIEYLEQGKIERKEGVKKEDFLKESKSITYETCLNVICKKFPEFNKKEKILNFHKIRNEIQHRARYIPSDKKEEIRTFYPCFKELYILMFPEHLDFFPDYSE